ncbi:molybdenum cofactor guanylyltransferase MobA [Mesosutterella sp. AGMB02718]|uniref:Molybdenum cofactor guanylyltransferase n=1 Tax=Mesosutterella faecium TaxID=2925194 RepID=A0ABT7IQC0_9BURK|nr:molybdenum cofactor guanylyltransferase MobA [Mesosutterella sp. AGMB02718]MDL2059496.1 molybdenum cofactor guanylyltransferase MobA [Mesosutterella sp. AGMB02718]
MRIYGLILAGGRATRMGGVDKGLQLFRGRPLALNAFERLKPQTDEILLSANRSEEAYRRMLPAGTKILPDLRPDFAGPLAGLEAAMSCIPEGERKKAWLVTVPCDCPFFPENLVESLKESGTPAVAAAGGRLQPSFLWVPASFLPRLSAYLDSGERKLGLWARQAGCLEVNFPDAAAFQNCNSFEELSFAEALSAPSRKGSVSV